MPTGFPDYYGGLTLPVTVPEGGTGLTTVDAHAVLIGAGTGTLHVLDPGTSGYVLTSQGTGADPIWAAVTVDVSNITGILAIAHGGTGTDSPALTAGTGIDITGSWPGNTITNSSHYASLADPLPVAHGGTGTDSPALTAGSNIDITGTWPANTIAVASAPTFSGAVTSDVQLAVNSDSYPQLFLCNGAGTVHWAIQDITSDGTQGPIRIYDYVAGKQRFAIDTSGNVSLGVPLGVASGGTGTDSPALTAGTGISISGSWPNQTITLGSDYQFPNVVAGQDYISQTTAFPAITTYTATVGGRFRASVGVFVDGGSGGATVPHTVKWTQHGFSMSLSLATGAAGASSLAASSGSAVIYPDADTVITIGNTLISSSTGWYYDVSAVIERL
ncbi:MAG: hypothetical protein ACRD4R_12980 [Candidatus Acidiferrales bacterium]